MVATGRPGDRIYAEYFLALRCSFWATLAAGVGGIAFQNPDRRALCLIRDWIQAESEAVSRRRIWTMGILHSRRESSSGYGFNCWSCADGLTSIDTVDQMPVCKRCGALVTKFGRHLAAEIRILTCAAL